MVFTRDGWIRQFARVTKTLLLWSMLISGIVLATRQARASLEGSFVIVASVSEQVQ
jgi:hypothetical protein